MKGKKRKHLGLREDRNDLYPEKVFSELWKKKNERIPWIDNGHGALDLILATKEDHKKDRPVGGKPTQRDADVAGTVIQWLGTKCGVCFLMEAERRIKKIDALESRKHHLINNLNVPEDHESIKEIETEIFHIIKTGHYEKPKLGLII